MFVNRSTTKATVTVIADNATVQRMDASARAKARPGERVKFDRANSTPTVRRYTIVK